MNDKQQQLTFDKGITKVPSDVICPDNDLSEYVGMVCDQGEHRPIQYPVKKFSTEDTVLLIHRSVETTRYVVLKDYESSSYIGWEIRDDNGRVTKSGTIDLDGIDVSQAKVVAVGNTLVVTVGIETWYFLWKQTDETYKPLGNQIPDPDVRFHMQFETPVNDAESIYTGENISWENNWEVEDVNHVWINTTEPSSQNNYNDIAIGLYAKMANKRKEQKRFFEPFLVRVAVELYDGTYARIGVPMLMLPSLQWNCISTFLPYESSVGDDYRKMFMYLAKAKLQYIANFDYSEWGDIVKDVLVFCTDGVSLVDNTGDQTITIVEEGNMCVNQYSGLFVGWKTQAFRGHHGYPVTKINGGTANVKRPVHIFRPLKVLKQADIRKKIKELSVFYKLASLGVKRSETATWHDIDNYIDYDTLKNLTTQDQLDGDYFSNSVVSGRSSFVYNGRLILSDINRSFYDGGKYFADTLYSISQDVNDQAQPFIIQVDIETTSGMRTVQRGVFTNEAILRYFFYPDPRAKRVRVYRSNLSFSTALKKVLDEKLEEHHFLNGAHFVGDLPTEQIEYENGVEEDAPPVINYTEHLSNQLYVSEVDNPYTFRPSGDVTAGLGTVLGVSSITQALSQGQFGQFPLIIFTSDGIWVAPISKDGTIPSVHVKSRDVCNNPDSITQTDNAVFFTTCKGLHAVFGDANGNVDIKLVSGQLGDRFNTLFEQARIAYDYKDSLLWILPKDTNATQSALIYSLISGTFSTIDCRDYFPDTDTDPESLLEVEDVEQEEYDYIEPEYHPFDDFSDITEDTHITDHIINPAELEDEGLTFTTHVMFLRSYMQEAVNRFVMKITIHHTQEEIEDGYPESIDLWSLNFMESEEYIGKDGMPILHNVYQDGNGNLWTWNGNSMEVYTPGMYDGVVVGEEEEQIPVDPYRLRGIINAYPDNLIQIGTGVFSLLDRPSETNDEEQYSCTIVSRPMKLENALALKSIMQVKHIYSMNNSAALACKIFASNNTKNWVEIKSLRGIPWKYYKFRFDFSNMKATDRFAGTILITQERRINKLR